MKATAGTAQRAIDAAKAAMEAAEAEWKALQLVALYAEQAEKTKAP